MPASLLDLPDELLLEITHHLLDEETEPLLRFASWPRHHERYAKTQSRRNARLTSLALTCRRLHAITTPLLYQSISFDFKPRRIALFSDINEDAPCLRHVKEVSGLVFDRTTHLHEFLSLPNIRSASIDGWDGSEPIPATYKSNYCSSNVTTLRLSDCRASKEALADLLRYPRALTELAIEANHLNLRKSVLKLSGFDAAAILGACSVQASTLQTLVFTQTPLTLEIENPEIRGSYKQFVALRHLKIQYGALVGRPWDRVIENSEAKANSYKLLPPSLRTLELHHHTFSMFPPYAAGEFVLREGWLTRLAENKVASLPELESVSFILEDNLGLEPGVWEDTFGKAKIRRLQEKLNSVGIVLAVSVVPCEDKEQRRGVIHF